MNRNIFQTIPMACKLDFKSCWLLTPILLWPLLYIQWKCIALNTFSWEWRDAFVHDHKNNHKIHMAKCNQFGLHKYPNKYLWNTHFPRILYNKLTLKRNNCIRNWIPVSHSFCLFVFYCLQRKKSVLRTHRKRDKQHSQRNAA